MAAAKKKRPARREAMAGRIWDSSHNQAKHLNNPSLLTAFSIPTVSD